MKKILFACMALMLAFPSCQQSAGSDDTGVSQTPPSSATEATEYTVSVTQPDFGGTVSVDKAKAKASETVTITTTANDGFELETISVKNGEATVTVTDKKFTMPSGNVTVNVAFAASSYTVKWDNGHFDNKFSLAKVKAYITQIGLVETTDYSIDKKNGVLTFTSDGYAKVAAYLDTNGEPTVTGTPADNGGNGTGDVKDEAISDGNLDIAKAIMFSSNLGTDWGDVIVTNANGQKIKSANAGAEITLTVKPKSGYELGHALTQDKDGWFIVKDNSTYIEVTYKSNGNITTRELTKVNDTTYTFVMPETFVTIQARFDPVDGYTVTSDYCLITSGQVFDNNAFIGKETKVRPGEYFTVQLKDKSKIGTITIDSKDFSGYLSMKDVYYAIYSMPAHDVAVTTTLKNQQ